MSRSAAYVQPESICLSICSTILLNGYLSLFIVGSNKSLILSPSKLKPNTAIAIAVPGAKDDHGNVVPIIVLSGWVSDEMSLNPPDGVRTVMKKPIDIDIFAATVAHVLAQSGSGQN